MNIKETIITFYMLTNEEKELGSFSDTKYKNFVQEGSVMLLNTIT